MAAMAAMLHEHTHGCRGGFAGGVRDEPGVVLEFFSFFFCELAPFEADDLSGAGFPTDIDVLQSRPPGRSMRFIHDTP